MPRKNVYVEIPDGTHLGFSHDTEGALRAHLFDDGTNELVGHAELFELAEDVHECPAPYAEPVYIYVSDDRSNEVNEELAEALRALALLSIIVAAEKAAPHLKRWWSDTALPFLKRSGGKLPTLRHRVAGDVADSAVQPEPTRDARSQDVLNALKECRASMSTAEARDRFVAALIARLFSEEQLRLLGNALIEDETGASGLALAAESLDAQQLVGSITLMLTATPLWPDDDTLAQFRSMLDADCGGSLCSPVASE